MLHQAIYLFCLRILSKNPSMVHFPPILAACERVRYQRQSSSPLEIEHHYLGPDSCSHFVPFFNTVVVDTATISYERFQERWCCTNTTQIHHFFSTNMSLATLTKWVHIPYLFTQFSKTLSILKDMFLHFVHHVYNTQIITEIHINGESLGKGRDYVNMLVIVQKHCTRYAAGWLKLVGCGVGF